MIPSDFVGRGDMSRGSLMLRAVREGTELPYMPVGQLQPSRTRLAKRFSPLDVSARIPLQQLRPGDQPAEDFPI
jgi:hypothetical protein